MNVSGCLFGSALTTAVRIVWKIIKVVSELIAKIIFYFGLYAPLAYLIYGAVLHWTFGLQLFGKTTDAQLYILGFALTLVIALILTVRNLIIRPYNKYFKRSEIVEYGKKQRLKKGTPEAPKIYKSRINPGVIVYEYANRYDLYEQSDDGLILVDTEFKKQTKRW